MRRGQASVEVAALAMALVLGLCLLVHDPGRVDAIGRALVGAILPDRPSPRPRVHRHRPPRPSPPRPPRASRCYCPA